MPTEVHRVVLYVVDHDQVGAAGVREVLEHARYPNRCISPRAVSVETCTVEWADDHPLNMRDTAAAAFAALFSTRTPKVASDHSAATALEAAIDRFGTQAAGDADVTHRLTTLLAARTALRTAIAAYTEAEVARRLAGAPEVEAAMDHLGDVAMSAGRKAGRAGRLPEVTVEWEDAESALRTAIAADKVRAVRDQDTTWQVHDLERDAEVARWQHEAHVLAQAIKSIASTVGVDDIPNGDGWAERMTTAIRGVISKLVDRARTQADEMARAVEAAEDAAFVRGRDAVRKFPDGWGLIARPAPDEARRLVDAVEHAAWFLGKSCRRLLPDNPTIARTSLLHALGVEVEA